jgi:hypothetical protein
MPGKRVQFDDETEEHLAKHVRFIAEYEEGSEEGLGSW